jgi:chaperone required for assembly of F1-ATPase
MKRFYKDVSTGPALQGGKASAVLLDGRPVRTPGKALLAAPSARLAEAIADEWRAQGESIDPATMPLTTLLTTCIDRIEHDREAIMLSVLAYLNGDLLCYRADPTDETGLVAEEERLRQPWLEWFAGRFGHRLLTTTALSALRQPDDAHSDIAAFLSDLDDARFNIVQVATSLTGSLVLALALLEGAITPQQAYECTLCEELFHERRLDLGRYGPDPIEQKRRDALLYDLEACTRFLTLL